MNIDILNNASEDTKKLLATIKNYIKSSRFNEKVYLSGQCVKDLILKNNISYISLSVEIENGGVELASFLTMKEKCFLIGTNPSVNSALKTATFNLPSIDIDIDATQTCKNRSIRFGTVSEDASSMTFTIDAIYYNLSDDKLYDPYNGAEDLNNGMLRGLGDISKKLKKNPYEILRGIRLASELGLGIDKDTWLAMIENSVFLGEEDEDVVGDEIASIALLEKPSVALTRLKSCGALKFILPDINNLSTIYVSKAKKFTAFDEVLKTIDNVEQVLPNRLAALFHNVARIGDDKADALFVDSFSSDVAKDDLRLYYFSSNTIKKACAAIKYHRYFDSTKKNPSTKKINKFLKEVGNENLGITIDLMACTQMASPYYNDGITLKLLKKISKVIDASKNDDSNVPISGNDLIHKLGIKPGPIVGKLMNDVRNAYYDNPNMSKDDCYKVAMEKIKEYAV